MERIGRRCVKNSMNFIIIFLANYLYVVIVVVAIIALVFAKKPIKSNMIMLALLTFPFAFIVATILDHFFYNPRPFVVEHIKPLIPHAANNGFPSDHTLLVISIASIVFVINKRLGSVLFVLGLLVGFARVLAEVHHPIDIFASIIVAVFSTYISCMILKKLKQITV